MADDDEIILSELSDDELVLQMHDDLYDGLKEEIEEGVEILLERGWTPYDGVTVTGWPVGTYVRGLKVMWEGELTTPSQGEPARFLEALPRSV